MPLFATTAITGPNGEQVDRDMVIPASWPVDSPFVLEGISQGWLVSRDVLEVSTLPATPPAPPAASAPPVRRGNRSTSAADHADQVDIGGAATREGEASA